jgi:hypothetical protein
VCVLILCALARAWAVAASLVVVAAASLVVFAGIVLAVRFVAMLASSARLKKAFAPLVLAARRLGARAEAIVERLPVAYRRACHSVAVVDSKARFQARRSRAATVPDEQDAAATIVSEPAIAFRIDVYQNEYLPADGTEVHAIISVDTSDPRRTSANNGEPPAPEAAEVIMLDCSGSMAYPLAKLREAQRATKAAIAALREGTWFAVVRATDRAELAYPCAGGLARATPESKQEAAAAVELMWPEGGTAMGSWLTLTSSLLAERPNAVAHAILLTDGANESESPESLESALSACEGRFQCDCRGVGTQWRVEELRTIAATLLGSVDIVAQPAALEDDFHSMIEGAMAKSARDVSLRVWTPRGARVASLKQVSPAIEDLTHRATARDTFTSEYPTGAWGAEAREYHLSVRVPRREVGEEMLAARVSAVTAGHACSPALVRAIWTDDEELSTRNNREVAHYTGQAQLAETIQEGLSARRSGDERAATLKLARAVQLAAASGNSETMRLLERVVKVADAQAGDVSLKRHVADVDEMTLDTRSTRTVRIGKR